jgi:DNA-binding GntR family transcriptional regulator
VAPSGDDGVDDAAEALQRFSTAASSRRRLRQTDLADQLAISRTPIREALSASAGGSGRPAPGGGVRVKLLGLDEAVSSPTCVRCSMAWRRGWPPVAPTVAGRALEEALARQARCVEREDAGPWFPAHIAFHEEIVRAAGNRHLSRLSSIVRLSIRHFHPLLLRTEHRLEQAWREHRAIYEAILTRDTLEAERLARQHIASAKEIVLKVMTQGAGDGAVQG